MMTVNLVVKVTLRCDRYPVSGTVQSALHFVQGRLMMTVTLMVKVTLRCDRYPVSGTVQSALHFTHWQTCSFQGHLDFSGKHLKLLPQMIQPIANPVYWSPNM